MWTRSALALAIVFAGAATLAGQSPRFGVGQPPTPDEIRESIEKQNGLDGIRNNLKTRKTVEALVSKAKVTEGEWVDPNAAEPVVEEDGRTKPKKSSAKKSDEGEEKKPAKKAAKKKTTGE